MRLEKLNLSDITISDRYRRDLGDIEELAEDIKKKGLICPIAVVGNEPPYKLVAGGRRLAAVKHLGLEEISCNIYDHDLSDLEIRSIELAENIMRKDLTYLEEVQLKREIHRLQVEIHGAKFHDKDTGQSMRDTAKLIRVSAGGLSQDIKLADAIEQFPGLGWEKCATKKEAMKVLDRMEEGILRAELAKRASKDAGHIKELDQFIVMDFFDHVRKLPDNTFDLVEVDPPYGINLSDIKLKTGGQAGGDKFFIHYGNTYNEIDQEMYLPFIHGVLKELYRIMNSRSWLIFWFGMNPWFEPIFNEIQSAGFKVRRMPAIWTKPGGQTLHPDIYLGSSYETFYYAYKGDAVINIDKRGRSNVFNFSPVPPSQKIHPTERPIELLEEILRTFAYEGARIYVPFCGSGNTLRAAQNLKMHPIGVDLGKEYKEGYVTRILGRRSR